MTRINIFTGKGKECHQTGVIPVSQADPDNRVNFMFIYVNDFLLTESPLHAVSNKDLHRHDKTLR